MSTASTRFAELGVPLDLCARLDAVAITEPTPIQSAVIPDALAGRDVAGQRSHRLGQDTGLRPAARHPAASGAAAASHHARARPDPGTGRADHERAAPVRASAPPRRGVGVRRRGLRPAAQGARRRRRARRGVPRPARRPSRIGSRVTRRRRPGRGRRSRSHGRHGLPPRGAPHPRPDQPHAPGAHVLCHLRRRGVEARRHHPARPRRPRDRSARTRHRCRPSRLLAGGPGRAPRSHGGHDQGDGLDDRVLPDAARCRSTHQATGQARCHGDPDPRRTQSAAARPSPARVRRVARCDR